MMSNQLALIRRELLEHRSIFVTPVVIAVVVSLMSLTGQVSISAFGQQVDLAILGASNVGEAERRAALSVFLLIISLFFAIGASILMVFYSLDALYAERRDKSILFWRSLPVTDTETVISKLVTAMFVIPLAAFAVVIATHLVNLVLWSIWLTVRGGDVGHLLWSSVPFLDNWSATLVLTLCLSLWTAPLIGWFLFVSAFTKRSPLLMAFLPLFILPMLEKLLLGTTIFWDQIFVRSFNPPLFHGFDGRSFFDEDSMRITADGLSLLAQVDLAKFFLSAELWLGIVVCALFSAAAIYVRRYRDES